jgi:hypothetical protein
MGRGPDSGISNPAPDVQNGAVNCKYCRSPRVRKYGLVEGTQRYFCNDCKRKFNSDDHLFRMKTAIDQVAAALEQFYRGQTIDQVRAYLAHRYNNYPSSKTVYHWIVKYTAAAIQQFSAYQPPPCNRCQISGAIIRIAGCPYWRLTGIDLRTSFLFGVKLSAGPLIQAVFELIDPSGRADGKNSSAGPRPELTDIGPLLSAVDRENQPFTLTGSADSPDLKLGDPGPVPTKSALAVLSRAKSRPAAERIMAGYQAQYNFLRSPDHPAEKTPAELAGLCYPAQSWLEVIRAANPDIRYLVKPPAETPFTRLKSRRRKPALEA